MASSVEKRADRRSILRAAPLALAGAIGSSALLGACQSFVTPSSGGAASQAPGQGGKPPRVVFVSAKPTDSFVTAVKNGADQAARDFGLDYVFQSPNNNTFPEQIQVTLAAIASNPDGMAIDYYGKAFEASTSRALDSGIIVVLYNNNQLQGENLPVDSRIGALAFVGQDESTSGERLANTFVASLPPGGSVLLINPFPQSYVLTARRDGVARVLDRAGFAHQDLNMDNSGDEGRYLSVIGPYLQAHPEIGAVIGLGNSGSNPAAKYLSDNHQNYPIATFDVGATTATYIQQGVVRCAVNQQPYLQGYMAVANLALALKFGFTPVNVNTGTSIVDGSNIQDVLRLIAEGKG
jgi:simple sugar transport system substrate-binding protein